METASSLATPASASAGARLLARTPPHAFFLVSAVFHYLGPAFAVLLFAHVAPLGVAWLRIASAALVFAWWRKPWRFWRTQDASTRRTILMLGIVLAAMNSIFYLAIARLPLSTVGAIEFIGPITLAAIGMRTARNVGALILATAGVLVLTDIRIVHEPLGFVFAFANCALFILYVVLGHRISRSDAPAAAGSGIDRLAAAMLIAAVAAAPIGFIDAAPAFHSPTLLGAAIGVGISSSVIPYVCDQLAMSRLSRSTFALLLALLPATAIIVGATVLHQIPSLTEIVGVGLVILGVAIHRERN
jgi:inner membrane transporter RhtA